MNKEKYQEFIDKLKRVLQTDDPNFSNLTLYRTLAALAALASMFLPWVQFDGANSGMNGADLVAYAFTSPERGSLFQTSFLGSLALLFIPITVTVLMAIIFFKTVVSQYVVSMNLVAGLLPLAMLFLARSIISSDQPSVIGVPLPEYGLLLMIICNLGLFANGLVHENDRRR